MIAPEPGPQHLLKLSDRDRVQPAPALTASRTARVIEVRFTGHTRLRAITHALLEPPSVADLGG